jgi:hypothetical protein
VQEERRYPTPSEVVRAAGRYFLEGLVTAGAVFAGTSDFLATHERG